MSQDVMTNLVYLSHVLGDPANDFAILGEGNTSARADGETFWVKASGTELRTMQPEGFVRVRFDKIMELLQFEDVSDDVCKEYFDAASVDAAGKRPSTEALMHAILLSMPDVNYVGHTHPTAINMFTCAHEGKQAWQGRLFPDEIVCCGVAPVWVDYTDPGIPLAREVKTQIEAYIQEYGVRPKVLLVQNHGLIAIGATPSEVINATMMMCKTARVLWGTFALGGPRYLTPTQVERIFTWPSEKYRMQLLENR
jgi:rhamnose utilization protein RhaD (predicted bifunctional aldolase and dehydrogenase)